MTGLRSLLLLIRPGVSFAVALGTLCGFVFYVLKYKTSYDIMWHSSTLASLGSFLLCAGCSALNQVQERKRDALMQRTADRPLASGLISPVYGIATAVFLVFAGLGAYFLANGLTLALTGIVVVISYNGVYTPLKSRTPLALLAGGIAGALPPVTGWIAAGGDPFTPDILALFGIFYLWQVPHFWLLAEKHAEDYRRAGFKLTVDRLPPHSRTMLMPLWVGAYFVGLAAFMLHSPGLSLACLLVGLITGLSTAMKWTRVARLLVDASLPLAIMSTLIILL